jgi:hypothetical protein
LARSFYDDAQNKRLIEVQSDPARACLLRADCESDPAIDSNHQGVVDRVAVFRDSEAMHLVRTAQEEKLTMALKYVFELFNCWDGGVNRSRMSKIRFHKVLRYAAILYVKAGPLSGQACLKNHVNHSFLFRQRMYDVFNGHML